MKPSIIYVRWVGYSASGWQRTLGARASTATVMTLDENYIYPKIFFIFQRNVSSLQLMFQASLPLGNSFCIVRNNSMLYNGILS